MRPGRRGPAHDWKTSGSGKSDLVGDACGSRPPVSSNGVILASLREVSTSKVVELLQESECRSLALLPYSVVPEMFEGVSDDIRVGVGPRATLRGTYRDRYSTLEDFRKNRFGWNDFFTVLDGDGPPVGLFAIRRGGWSFIALTDENVEVVLAALVAPPHSCDWPNGAELS